MEIQRQYPSLNLRFENEVCSNRNDSYDVMVQVHYDESPTKDPTFESIKARLVNKPKLEKFVRDNEIHVHEGFELAPNMSLRMTGNQILELAKKNYMKDIVENTTVATTAEM